MAAYTAHPPHHHHFTERVSPSHALSLLSSYLEAASTKAYLHPNALLTPNGPPTPATGAQNMGLVLHNLKRVEAGLKGEQLGGDLTFERHGGQGLPGLMPTENSCHEMTNDGVGGGSASSEGVGEGWQDKTVFEREQEVVQGEIGKRDHVADGGRDARKVPTVEPTKTTADKEERKKRKKRRRMDERKSDEIKKQRTKDSAG